MNKLTGQIRHHAFWEKTILAMLENEEAGNAIQIVTGLNGQHMLRLFETKRYILRLVYEENLDIEVPRFQNENNKFLKLEKIKIILHFSLLIIWGIQG